MDIYKVLDGDTYQVCAKKIFDNYECGQSCTIKGLVLMPDETIEIKGRLVCKELERLDRRKNFTRDGVRIYRKPKNSIGDRLRGKTFKFVEETTVNNIIKVTIWRIQ